MLLTTGAAQPTPDCPNSGQRLIRDNITGAFELTWWGKEDFYYFVQQSDNLMEWSYLPLVEEGFDDPLAIGFESNTERLFLRVRYSNDPASDLLSADYNGIYLSAWDQIQLGFNPFDWVDTDENNLHDAWELHYFGSLGVDPSVVSPNPDLTHADAFALGADPTIDESTDPALRENFTYDARGWLSSYQPATGDAQTFSFDPEGNLTEGQ